MSIDLNVGVEPGVTAQELREGIRMTLTELTGNPATTLLLWTMANGERAPMDDNDTIVCDALVLVEASDVDAQIALTISPSFEKAGMFDCAISAECSRSAVEFVLAASCAIWFSRRSKTQIRDEWQFWTGATAIEPDDLVGKIRVNGIGDLSKACKNLVGTRIESE